LPNPAIDRKKIARAAEPDAEERKNWGMGGSAEPIGPHPLCHGSGHGKVDRLSPAGFLGSDGPMSNLRPSWPRGAAVHVSILATDHLGYS
jgi:hypothetical protein